MALIFLRSVVIVPVTRTLQRECPDKGGSSVYSIYIAVYKLYKVNKFQNCYSDLLSTTIWGNQVYWFSL